MVDMINGFGLPYCPSFQNCFGYFIRADYFPYVFRDSIEKTVELGFKETFLIPVVKMNGVIKNFCLHGAWSDKDALDTF